MHLYRLKVRAALEIQREFAREDHTIEIQRRQMRGGDGSLKQNIPHMLMFGSEAIRLATMGVTLAVTSSPTQ